MRFALFALALVSSSAAFAQATYIPPEVRIMRTDVRTENQTDSIVTCITGTIRVSERDDVTISLRPCRAGDGSVRSVTSTNQSGGITAGVIDGDVTVTNSPGAITGSNLNIDRVDMGNGTVIITGVSGMATTGREEAIVRQCLTSARALQRRRGQSTYINCLRAGLGSEGYTVN